MCLPVKNTGALPMNNIIDSDDYAASGIKTFFFPGGEPHAVLPESLSTEQQKILLFLKLRTWSDVGLAIAVINALEQRIETKEPGGWFNVFVPYFPGARQDRTDGNTPLTTDLMARVLGRGIKFSMAIFDAHSYHLHGLGRYQEFTLRNLDIATKSDVVGIIAPDKGAVDRANSFRAHFYPKAELIRCEKKRNFATGAFEGFEMPPLPVVGRYIIVDDICDGGGTFNLLAEAFDKDAAGIHSVLELVVSHGIFSKGLIAISPRIEHITTTNSWCQIPAALQRSGRLTILKLEQLFPQILGESNVES